jgi:hypothetical protein
LPPAPPSIPALAYWDGGFLVYTPRLRHWEAAVPVMSASPSGLDSDDSSSAHEERGSSVLSEWYDADSYGTMSETTNAESDDPQDFDGFQCR